MKNLIRTTFVLIFVFVVHSFGVGEKEPALSDLQLEFLLGMSGAFKDVDDLPRFWNGENEKEKLFHQTARRYLANIGVPEEVIQSKEYAHTLEGALKGSVPGLAVEEKAARLAGLFARSGTTTGIQHSGSSYYANSIRSVFAHNGSLNVTFNPGYPGNTIYSFEEVDDQLAFNEFMVRIRSVVKEEQPISILSTSNRDNPWPRLHP